MKMRLITQNPLIWEIGSDSDTWQQYATEDVECQSYSEIINIFN